jgi:putative transposase
VAYSEDLRKRLLGFLEEGNSISEASRIFSVCRETIYKWLRLGPENLKPQKTGPKSHTKLVPEKLALLVKEKPEAYLSELADELGVSSYAVSYGLKKLKITRKKKQSVQGTKRRATQAISARTGKP